MFVGLVGGMGRFFHSHVTKKCVDHLLCWSHIWKYLPFKAMQFSLPLQLSNWDRHPNAVTFYLESIFIKPKASFLDSTLILIVCPSSFSLFSPLIHMVRLWSMPSHLVQLCLCSPHTPGLASKSATSPSFSQTKNGNTTSHPLFLQLRLSSWLGLCSCQGFVKTRSVQYWNWKMCVYLGKFEVIIAMYKASHLAMKEWTQKSDPSKAVLSLQVPTVTLFRNTHLCLTGNSCPQKNLPGSFGIFLSLKNF